MIRRVSRSILFYACSVLFILMGALQAMELPKILGKIPLDDGLKGMAPCGPNTFVICKDIGLKDCYEVFDFSGHSKNFYHDNGNLHFILPLNDVEVMLVDLYGSSVRKLNIETGKFSEMFELVGMRPQDIESCSIIKKGLIQCTYLSTELAYEVMIFNYEQNNIEKKFIIAQTLPTCMTTGGEKYIFCLTEKHDLLIWDTDTGMCVQEIKIPLRTQCDDLYINRLCYISDSNRLILTWNDGIISIWDLGNKTKVQEFKGHDGWISSVIHLGKNFFVTAGADGLVKTWHVSSDECQHVFDGHKTDAHPEINNLMLLASGLVASAANDNIQISSALFKFMSYDALAHKQAPNRSCSIF